MSEYTESDSEVTDSLVAYGTKNAVEVRDYHRVKLDDAFKLTLDDILGEGFTPFSSEHYKIRVHSIDLKRLFVETDFGLTVGLAPDESSFFSQTFDDDTSYKLLCPDDLTKLKQRHGVGNFLVCPGCNKSFTDWPRETSQVLWLSSGGMQLCMDKAVVVAQRAGGNFPVHDPEEVANFLKTHDFTSDIVEWVSPFIANPLQAHAVAWDLAETLDDIWKAWKAVKKIRKIEKKLAGFRLLEETFNDINWEAWSKHKQARTGSSVQVKIKEKK